MRCAIIQMGGRLYRYSIERRTSGRPALIQFLNNQKVWRDVRNVDKSDLIWREADEGTFTPLYFDTVTRAKQ